MTALRRLTEALGGPFVHVHADADVKARQRRNVKGVRWPGRVFGATIAPRMPALLPLYQCRTWHPMQHRESRSATLEMSGIGTRTGTSFEFFATTAEENASGDRA
jgi:hypothetical protein